MRIFNTYGPRMRLTDGRAIPTFIRQALRGEPLTVYGDGSQTRSFCYVSDLVDGIWRLMNAPVNEPVNLGNPREMTLLELAQHDLDAERLAERDRVPAAARRTIPRCASPTSAGPAACSSWEPTLAVEEGLRRTLEWYRKPGTA